MPPPPRDLRSDPVAEVESDGIDCQLDDPVQLELIVMVTDRLFIGGMNVNLEE